MIDGDNAERGAIERTFRGLPIRMCHFHLMQACRSQGRKIFGRGKAGKVKTTAFLDALRRCQRCPDQDDFPDYYRRLEQEIQDIAGDEGEALRTLTTYLKAYWFSDLWRSKCVDYGIPRHLTRDGPWSPNNFA